jgi:hypothetical protein
MIALAATGEIRMSTGTPLAESSMALSMTRATSRSSIHVSRLDRAAGSLMSSVGEANFGNRCRRTAWSHAALRKKIAARAASLPPRAGPPFVLGTLRAIAKSVSLQISEVSRSASISGKCRNR